MHTTRQRLVKGATGSLVVAGLLVGGMATSQATTSPLAQAAALSAAATTACGFRDVYLSPDLNGNQHGDVVAVKNNGEMWLWPGSASGKLGAALKLGDGWGTMRLYFPGDWDGDGKNDIIGIDSVTGRMFLYRGNGNGGFGGRLNIGQGWGGYRVIPAGDLNGDGHADLLAIKESTGGLYLYAGNGMGGFKYPYPKVGNGWIGYQLYAASDVNKDGNADILSINSRGDMYFYAGKGNGTFAKKIQVGNGWKGYDLAAGADINGDGMADIVSRYANGTLYFYAAKGGGKFAKRIQIGTGFTADSATCPKAPPKTDYICGDSPGRKGLPTQAMVECAVAPYNSPYARGCNLEGNMIVFNQGKHYTAMDIRAWAKSLKEAYHPHKVQFYTDLGRNGSGPVKWVRGEGCRY
ncbi:MAG: VCBS repeat-containing protein [Micrococcales bacterium]|nr:VCBS repeat-containing protein [Micrococcales bacterium]